MRTVAYFCAEFGINDSLPFYAGGLGVLAGDHVKSANDLGIPLVAVGLLYRKGYFQQHISADGHQVALSSEITPEEIPVTPVLDDFGTPLLIEVTLDNRVVNLKAWCSYVGTVPVYFLDADVEENQREDRCLTASLYPCDQDIRLKQEILLGIGGVRFLRKLGIQPGVWHLNEGHVAFMVLERIREYSVQGIPFEAALEAVRASTVFTTHTPVPAGHDEFSFELLDKYLRDYYWQLGASREEILELGKLGAGFNLTRLASRASSKVNGVSKLHADVTKQLFHRWTPEIPWQDISVEAITNGIHINTWMAPEMKELLNNVLDKNWELQSADKDMWKRITKISDQQLWNTHLQIKAHMLERIGLPAHLSHALVIGFARRFATYKRATLLFDDLERLDRLVNNPEHPVCFIYAGKAHPADDLGQEFLRKIIEISRMERFRERIYFVENYNIESAKPLVQGVDLWLNTPIKPMEASGTSGQKAAINGVLNCSVLDGWWDEGYNEANGWAIHASEGANQTEQNHLDRECLFGLLENKIVPMYYCRDQESLPREWIVMMKESISSLTPVFSSNRMVNDYLVRLYAPTISRGLRFTANNLEVARGVAAYKQYIRKSWDQVQIETMEFSDSVIQCHIHLGSVLPKDIRVEAVGSYHTGELWKEKLELQGILTSGLHIYRGRLPLSSDKCLKSDANIRVVPINPDFSNDFELELTLWGRS